MPQSGIAKAFYVLVVIGILFVIGGLLFPTQSGLASSVDTSSFDALTTFGFKGVFIYGFLFFIGYAIYKAIKG